MSNALAILIFFAICWGLVFLASHFLGPVAGSAVVAALFTVAYDNS
jgi:hypothetical protein